MEDRPIWALRIGESKGNARKLLFMGCHHAREWIAVEVPFPLADHLVKNASQDPIKQWLWVAPMGQVPSDDTYIGPRAFSEPETRAVRDLIGRELFRGVITYHSYSQLILYPWGYTSTPIVDPPRYGENHEVGAANGRVDQSSPRRGVHSRAIVISLSDESRRFPGVTPLSWLALEGENPDTSAGRCSPTLGRAHGFVSAGEDVLHAGSTPSVVSSTSVCSRLD